MQSTGVLIHRLHEQHLLLIKTIAVQFCKSGCIKDDTAVCETDFTALSNYLPLEQMAIGNDTRLLLNELGEREQKECLYLVRICIPLNYEVLSTSFIFYT